MDKVSPKYRIQFFGGQPLVTTKYSGKTAGSLYRSILDVNAAMAGFSTYVFYFPGFEDHISYKDYLFSIFISKLHAKLNNGKIVVYLRYKDEIWKS